MLNPKIHFARMLSRLNALFGRGQVVTMTVIVLIGLVSGVAIFMYMGSAAPNTIIIAGGPVGSAFQNNAEKYKKILARDGVVLKIIPSEGSRDNLSKLGNPQLAVDVGFVLGGEVIGAKTDNLVSLGSVAYQPLMIFYRGKTRELLSDFKGQRMDIGQEGSGAHSLALTLLKANGFEPNDGTVLVNTLANDAVAALYENRIDALFMMAESTSTEMLRQLLHNPDIHLFSFSQADAYTRRIHYLNKLELPKGSFDFGKNIPATDMLLVGPTVELIARNSLHPALSDLLLEAAREVHGTPGLFRKRNEFPAPLEHEFRISPDAVRYYASGKSFMYRTFPFWIASLITRVLAVIVPVALLLIPALKITPAIYRWRVESRIYRWYRVLLEFEREAFKHPVGQERLEELLQRLDHIERNVNKIVIPASCGNLYYGLREHVSFVRVSLHALRMPVA
jgi:TRAP-type uncharacterized transport system substrate-binding protein